MDLLYFIYEKRVSTLSVFLFFTIFFFLFTISFTLFTGLFHEISNVSVSIKLFLTFSHLVLLSIIVLLLLHLLLHGLIVLLLLESIIVLLLSHLILLLILTFLSILYDMSILTWISLRVLADIWLSILWWWDVLSLILVVEWNSLQKLIKSQLRLQ